MKVYLVKNNRTNSRSRKIIVYYTSKISFLERKQKNCLACNKELQGRRDKKYCDPYCKSAFYYKKVQEDNISFYVRVDRQLKTNRRILKNYNKAGKATVRVETLLNLGFKPKFFTHFWKNRNDEVYRFVYEFGFLIKVQNGKKKYVLVTWQPYMA